MRRLFIVVEGPSEAAFASLLLKPHLGIEVVPTSLGGMSGYGKPRNEILRWLKQNPGREVRVTTMLDLYELPETFPGFEKSARLRGRARVEALEQALAADIDSRSGRFIPYIQLHEFEALLLADPEEFREYYVDAPASVRQLTAIVGQQCPEEINDRPATAPSKRISELFGAYPHEKPAASLAIAKAIGIDTMRAKCPHFNAWLTKLEAFAAEPPAT